MRLNLNRVSLRPVDFLCVFIAIALQIQITISLYPDHVGLRLSLADIALPLTGMAILASLLMKKSTWPQWEIRYTYFWLSAITLIFIAAFFHTYALFEQWSTWAFVNKIIGWFVLVAYFCLGGWIATNAENKAIVLFLKTFFYFFLFVLLILISATLLQSYTPVNLRSWIWPPIEGLMANRNAYAFLFMAVITIPTTNYLNKSNLFLKWSVCLLWFLLPITLLFIGSRALLISLPLFLILMFLVLRQKDFLHLLLCLLLGMFFLVGIYHSSENKFQISNLKRIDVVQETINTDQSTIDNLQEEVTYKGDNIRLKVLEDSFELIKERPFLGTGLGSLFIYQKDKRDEVITITENTALWLWVETGLPGLLVFFSFYFIILKQLWQNRNLGSPVRNTLSLSVFWILIAFAFMSQFHELLYSRFLWFFLGLALASQAVNQKAETTASEDQKADFPKPV